MEKTKIKRLFFSELMLSANHTKRIVYVALLTAFNVVTNMFLEFRMNDTQFSITIAMSVVTGVLLGGAFGFISCFIGDLIGFMINSWGFMYMPWVGMSTAVTAFIAGIIINGVNFKFKGNLAVKIVLVCLLSLFVCTIGINSTGFYFYNYKLGFSTAVIDYVKRVFGTNVGYFGYVAYRMIFKGQILNCLFNYALLGALVPLVLKVQLIKKKDDKKE